MQGPGLYNVRLTDALGIDVRGDVIVTDDVTENFDAVTQPEELR
jgi:hypothetical protein